MFEVTLSPSMWNLLFGWLGTGQPCRTQCGVPLLGALFYGLVGSAFVLIGGVVRYRGQPDSDLGSTSTQSEAPSAEDLTSDNSAEEVASIPTPDEDTESTESSTTADEPVLPELDTLHQQQIAPSWVHRDFRQLQVGTQHRKVFAAETYPDVIRDGALSKVFTRPDLQFDLSMHISPRDRQRARRDAEQRAESLEADADVFARSGGSGGQFRAGDKREAADRAAAIRDAIQDGQRPADVSMYVSVRADDEETLNDQAQAMRTAFSDSPANIGLQTVAGLQGRALESVAPIGQDVLATEAAWSPEQVMLGEGVGALLGSVTQNTLNESGGIELGEHAFNGSPLIKDPFKTGTNYNEVVIGDSGTGKSVGEKLRVLRTKAAQEDTMVVFLDPLDGFAGVGEALDAQRITVGGSRSLNPLEIRQPTAESQSARQRASDEDPLDAKLRDVMSFFDNFAHQSGQEFGAARPQLQSAVKAAYERKGITHDVDTHGRESPTIDDVLDVLEEMAESPEEFVVRTAKEATDIEMRATELLGQLRPFVDGHYTNLAQKTDFDFRDEDVIYLDLSQQEGSGGGSGLMMQLLFSLVYERAKETPKNVVFVVDEARYLLREAKSLEFLGQRIRHSRHFDTSIRFLTQNVRDFFSHEEAESIINNSAMTVLHRTEEIDEWQDTFGLTDQQVQFVERARTGDGGYSEALVEIEDEWYPIQVIGNDAEMAVVEGE